MVAADLWSFVAKVVVSSSIEIQLQLRFCAQVFAET